MSYEKSEISIRLKDFGKIVKRGFQENRKLFHDVDSDCFRIYDMNIGDIPVTVDIYGKKILITDYRTDTKDTTDQVPDFTTEQLIDAVSTNLHAAQADILVKKRKKLSAHAQHSKITTDRARWTEVREHGLKYLVELESYSDTGLFLDHSVTRNLILGESARKNVLNLFCYTGSFSVCAAAGWAKKVVSVDVSSTYLKWAEKNFALNKLHDGEYLFIQEECKSFLQGAVSQQNASQKRLTANNKKTANQKSEKFDIIILDPPSFSDNRKQDGIFRVQKDYGEFIRLCARLLNNNGVIIFSTNLSSFRLDMKSFSDFHIQDITRDTVPPGYSYKKPPHYCWIFRKK